MPALPLKPTAPTQCAGMLGCAPDGDSGDGGQQCCSQGECFNDCGCRACSEIKAADQSGQCAKGGKWRMKGETYRECVERVATISTTNDGKCTAEDVKKKLDECIGVTLP